MLVRPCLLVVDHEFAGSISTRKLVLETAKFNVVTAYSYEEAFGTLERFPGLHGVVVSSGRGHEAVDFLQFVREHHPAMKRILTGELPEGDVADIHVESFSPDKLLAATLRLFPVAAAAVERREVDLAKEIGQA